MKSLFKRGLFFLLLYGAGFLLFLSSPPVVCDWFATQFQNHFGTLGNEYQLAFFPGYSAIRVKSFFFNKYASDIVSDYPVSYLVSCLLLYFSLGLASIRRSFSWLIGFLLGGITVYALCFAHFAAYCYHFLYFDYIPHTPLAADLLTKEKLKWVDHIQSLTMILLYVAPVAGWVICQWSLLNALLKRTVRSVAPPSSLLSEAPLKQND